MSQLLRKWIKDGAVNSDKIDSTDSYTMAGLNITGDATVTNLIATDATVTNNLAALNLSFTDLNVSGNLTVGGLTRIGTNFTAAKDATCNIFSFTSAAGVNNRAAAVGFFNLNVIQPGTFSGHLQLYNTMCRGMFTFNTNLTLTNAWTILDYTATASFSPSDVTSKYCIFVTGVSADATTQYLRFFNRLNTADTTVVGSVDYYIHNYVWW